MIKSKKAQDNKKIYDKEEGRKKNRKLKDS